MQERLNLKNQPYLGEDGVNIDLDNTHGYRSANVRSGACSKNTSMED